MNILMINGSPRGERSNSWKLAKAFLKGCCAQAGDTPPAIREVSVHKMHLEPCKGCFSCWRQTKGQCCIKDDAAAFLEDRLWADLSIWSFPLYYYSVPGELKLLIDRQLPMVLPFMTERTDGVGNGSHPSRFDMSGKKQVLISTCGFFTARGNYDGVTTLFDHIFGKDNYESVFCGQGELFGVPVPQVQKLTEQYLETVTRAGREYFNGGICEETKELLSHLLMPKEMFEAMADASW